MVIREMCKRNTYLVIQRNMICLCLIYISRMKSVTFRWRVLVYSHVVHEQGMVGPCTNDPNFNAMLWIPIQKLIVHVYLNSQIVHKS